MTRSTRLFACLALGFGTLAFVGCDDDDANPPPANPGAGPAERAGEKIDRAAEDVRDAARDARK
jgi:hypothetical protein